MFVWSSCNCLHKVSGVFYARFPGALNVENISSELKGVTEWRQLGTQLGLQPDKLREIENEHPTDIERCKVEAVNIWLRSTPGASWRHIVTALREVGEITTAERIELKHVKGSRGMTIHDTTESHGRVTCVRYSLVEQIAPIRLLTARSLNLVY